MYYWKKNETSELEECIKDKKSQFIKGEMQVLFKWKMTDGMQVSGIKHPVVNHPASGNEST